MRQRMGFVLILVVLMGAAGCIRVPEDTDTSVYRSQGGGFEIRVPNTWQPRELGGLLSGVEFTSTSAGANTMRFWILHAPSSGRSATQIIEEDAELLRALLVDAGTTLSNWDQEPSVGKTIGGMNGRESAYSATLSGWYMLGLVWAFGDGTNDYVILAEASAGAYQTLEEEFTNAINSFSRL